MKKLEHSHLVKPLLVQGPPSGLYNEPRVWMEGKDLEGFKAHFSYGFIKEESTVHPIEGHLIHPYDEILVFAGIDHTDIKYLGAEVSIEMGNERESYIFNKPTYVLVPKGLPHGAVKVKNIEKPIVHYTIGLSPEYKAEAIVEGDLPPIADTKTHTSLVRRLLVVIEGEPKDERTRRLKENGFSTPAKTGFATSGVNTEQVGRIGPGNADQLVWLFGPALENMDVNFAWGYYTGCGIWHRGGEAHTHPEEEILVYVGLDPDNLDYLGSELELGMGEDGERHVFNKPTVAICPQGFPHLPLITRWVDKPYSFMVICLSGEHDSPWVK